MTDRQAPAPRDENIASHDAPVWRDRANFLIHARLLDAEPDDRWQYEQLWCRRVDEFDFEICCIPWYLYDIALGDIVRTDSDLNFLQRVHDAGHFTFRAWIENGLPRGSSLLLDVVALGGLVERHSPRWIAIDVEAPVAQDMADLLMDYQNRGELIYETGRS